MHLVIYSEYTGRRVDISSLDNIRNGTKLGSVLFHQFFSPSQ